MHPTEFADPFLKREVELLETEVQNFMTAFEARNAAKSLETLLNICRPIQRIRFEIVTLFYLPHALRNRTGDALQRVLDQFKTVMANISLFTHGEQSWVISAFKNIEQRLPEAIGGPERVMDNREIEIPPLDLDVI